MRIGARTLKTGLAVFLTIFLVNILETRIYNVEYNLAGMAAITAIVGMQPSIRSSIETFRERLIATFIGSLFALVLAAFLEINAFTLGLTSIVIILICLKLGLDESIRFSLITLCAVSTYHSDVQLIELVYRVSGILMGITVSAVLNVFFMPPDYTEALKDRINNLRMNFENLYFDIITDISREEKISQEEIKSRRNEIREEIELVREVYVLLEEDFRNKDEIRVRKYKRSINALQSNLDRLIAIHRSILLLPLDDKYSVLSKNLYLYLKDLLNIHSQVYACIVLDRDYIEYPLEENFFDIKKDIIKFIREDEEDYIFEFYNIYFEAIRIHEKIEQIQEDFSLCPRKA